jgi:hypothetical protein
LLASVEPPAATPLVQGVIVPERETLADARTYVGEEVNHDSGASTEQLAAGLGQRGDGFARGDLVRRHACRASERLTTVKDVAGHRNCSPRTANRLVHAPYQQLDVPSEYKPSQSPLTCG